jgi:PAS domain S-box-containing protein
MRKELDIGRGETMRDDSVNILIVEDDESHAELIRRSFNASHVICQLTVAKSLAEAKSILAVNKPDLLITDYRLPDGLGTELLPLDDQDAAFAVVVMTSYGSQQLAVDALKAGAIDYMVKSASSLSDLPALAMRVLRQWNDILKRREAEDALRASEYRYREIHEKVKLISVSLDIHGNITFCNDFLLNLTGWRQEEVVGLNWFDKFVPPDKRDEIWQIFLTAFPNGNISVHEVNEIVTKSGERLTISWSNVVLRDTSGNVIGTSSLGEDITERKKAEDNLVESQRLQHAILDNIPDIAWLKDNECRFLAVNEPFAKSCGLKPDDLLGKTDFDIWPYDLACKYRGDDLEVMRTGKRVQVEEFLDTADGQRIYIDTIKTPIVDDHGDTIGTTGIARDITQRKEVEKNLQFKTNLLVAQSETTPEGILVVDSNRKCVSLNKRFGEMFRIPLEVLATRDDIAIITFAMSQLKDPDSFIRKVEYLYDHPEEKTQDEIEFKDGKIFERYSSPLSDQTGNLGRIWFFRDVTIRKRAEEALEESESRLKTITDSAIDAILMIDSEGKVSFWNPAAENILGYSSAEAIGQNLHDLISPKRYHDAHHKAFSEFLRTGQGAAIGKNIEVEARRKDGKEISISLSLSAVHVNDNWHAVGIVRDITDIIKSAGALRASEEQYRTLFECSQDALMTIAPPAFKFTSCNSACIEMFGSKGQDEFKTLGPWDVSPEFQPDGRVSTEKAREMIEKTIKEGSASFEWIHKRINGEEFPASVILTRMEMNGEMVIHASVRDETELKNNERALRESEEKFRTFFECSQDALMILSPTRFNFTACNPACLKLFGLIDEEELKKLRPWDLSPEFQPDGRASKDKVREMDEIVVREGTNSFEWTHKRLNGEEFPCTVTLTMMEMNGELVLHSTVRDETDKKRKEQALRESEEQYRTLFECSKDALNILNPNTLKFVSCNPACLKMFGAKDEEEYKSVGPLDLAPEIQWDGRASIDKAREIIETVMRDGSATFEWTHKRLNGEEFPTTVTTAVLEMNGEIVLYGNVRDETDRKIKEKDLARLAAIIKQTNEIVVVADPSWMIQYVNPAFENITGFHASEIMGQNMRTLFTIDNSQDGIQAIEHTQGKGETWSGRVETNRKDGTVFYQETCIWPIRDSSGAIVSLVSYGRDITEQLALERQLRQAQKLQSIGQLAAGIAHEINTPMQYLGDNTHFLKDSYVNSMDLLKISGVVLSAIKAGNVTEELVKEIEKAIEKADLEYTSEEVPKALEQSLEGIERVSRIVQAMKEFSHPGVENKTATDINKAIESTITVSRNEWKYVAELSTDLAPDLPLIPCFPGELNQTFLNLITNAAHAIKKQQGDESSRKGTISISTRLDGDWVEIVISDTGAGIPENIRDRVFDPFFTTKEVGKGTGQGLSICHSVIVDKHKGTITFNSEVGVGTSFILRLPVNFENETDKDHPVG